jgi:hypothetical protein
LGFDVLLSRSFFFRPPFRSQSLLHRAAGIEGLAARFLPHQGGAYLVLARKRVVTLTPIRPLWAPQRGLVPTGLAEPTARQVGLLDEAPLLQSLLSKQSPDHESTNGSSLH